jgi:LmbE family N-acetylglucosaminyl deacetylase
MKTTCRILVSALTLAAGIAHPTPGSVPAPLEPASTGGLVAVDRALARLSIHARLLVIGAHPDDEDNALMTYVSRWLGGEVAYLSLSRGEGGQNLIGSELGVELGAIRTGELLAARRVEGTRQFFARAYDFGYTRSLDETFERWPREILQRDAIRAARRFKPQVVAAIFPADSRARHGQHEASAVIAEDVYRMAGDPTAFPELGEEGLQPWQPRAHYRRAWSRDEATVDYSLGRLEPISGRSVGQIAASSRSLHRSQDMGMIQPLGEGVAGLVWLAGGGGKESKEIFAGIDTRLRAIAEVLPEAEEKREMIDLLERAEVLAHEARSRLSPANLEEVVPALVGIIELLTEAAAGVEAEPERKSSTAVADLLAEKLAVAETGLAAAAGVAVDAVSDRSEVSVGESLEVTAEVWAAGGVEVEVHEARLVSAAGWELLSAESAANSEDPGHERWSFSVRVPAGSAPSTPYFLQRPRIGDVYDWTDVSTATLGEPFGPPPLEVHFQLKIAGVPVNLVREVVYRWADQAFGERRSPLRALPRLEVSVSPRLRLWRLSGEGGGDVEVVLQSNVEEPVAGTVTVSAPEGWSPRPLAFAIDEPHGSRSLDLELTPPSGTEPGRYLLDFEVELEGGGRFATAHRVIDYPHIRPSVVPREATLVVSAFDVELPAIGEVGYVLGASDRVPGILSEVGISVRILTTEELRHGDLGRYGAILIGSRAYEINPALSESNGRLLDYVRRGGLLVTQYQQYQFVRGGYAPFPLEIARPHGRVTDETAAVTHLVPEDSVFHWPNEIGPPDWDGWVQERGLYFADSWDERYTALLEMRDPGQPTAESGALLVARVGEGTYVYSGLSFFRQLPVGVPGAIRLLANILGLGER